MAVDALRRRSRPDYLFIICLGVLLLLGLIIIYSISPILSHKLLGNVNRNYFLYNQLLHISLGLAGFIFAANFHYSRWQKLVPMLVVGTGLSLLLLMIPALSLTKNGATRWVALGPLSFQPAELMKLTLILLVAGWLANLTQLQLREHAKTLWPMLGLLGLVAILVLFIQKDMGTTLIIAASLVGMFYASGVNLRQLWVIGAAGLAAGLAGILMFPHRLERLLTFFNPSQGSISGEGYHLNQALIAIGSGGLFGLGIGKSVQVWGYLPEAANDSIFAIVGETLGLAGGVAVMSVFGFMIYRGLRIALGCGTRYGQLLGLGIMIWVGSQTLLNITAMTGLVPLTGIPLPFLSYGGTSLVVLMVAMGIMVNLSRQGKRGSYEDSAIRRRNGRTHYAYSGYRSGP